MRPAQMEQYHLNKKQLFDAYKQKITKDGHLNQEENDFFYDKDPVEA
jgi:hypothetical protein